MIIPYEPELIDIANGPSGVSTLYDGTGSGYALAPGEAASFAVANSNTIYVNGTIGDVFTFQGNASKVIDMEPDDD